LPAQGGNSEELYEGRGLEVQVEVVLGPHHAVPEAVGGHGELQRHEGVVGIGEIDPVLLDRVVHYLRINDALEEVVEDDVLVVLAQHLPGPSERPAFVHQLVVGSQEGDLHLRNDGVVVVTWVPDQGRAVVLGIAAPSLP
jgi:hypothetical protein